ncbi:MAG: hypothetical protein WA865_11715 [Spirulinaceae cyanobacterium]
MTPEELNENKKRLEDLYSSPPTTPELEQRLQQLNQEVEAMTQPPDWLDESLSSLEKKQAELDQKIQALQRKREGLDE